MIINTDIPRLLKPPPTLDTKWREQIIDLFGVAFGKHFERVWELQLDLLEVVSKVEAEITSLRSDSKDQRSQIPHLLAQGDMLAVRANQSKAMALSQQADERRYLRACLLMIGDHIAARLLDPDTIRRFSNFQSAGFLGGKDGLKAEIRAAESFIAQGYMVLFNDLTHSLRVGDLTLKKGAEIRTFEVKSNPAEYHSKEAVRQTEIPRTIHDYIKTDVMVQPHRFAGVPGVVQGAVRLDSDITEDWQWDIAGQIHKGIHKSGVTHVVRGKKHYLAARRREVEELASMLETLTSEGEWVVSSIQRRVEDHAEVSPFTQWFKLESAVEIMAGDLIVLSAFKMADLASLFAAKGHRLTWKRKMIDLFPIGLEGVGDAWFKADERPNVGDHHRLKLMYAFLAIESYVDIVTFLVSPEASAQMTEKLSRSSLGTAGSSLALDEPLKESGTIQ
ncbi:MAG TPA: hypothetical protein VGK29_22980 [Paludibaculum sp.]